MNKNVCPNCGQLYDPELPKCPLCGQAPQVVDTDKPVQRHRITEAERRQRRAERRDAEMEARRRRRDEQLARDAEEERLLEEEEALRREERRRIKEEKKALRQQKKQAEAAADQSAGKKADAPEEKPVPAPQPIPAERPAQKARTRQTAAPEPVPTPVVTPAPVRTKQRPEMQEKTALRDRGRVPRVFLVLCTLLLAVTMIVGGSYLLWKLGTVKLPIYDKLAAMKDASDPKEEKPGETEEPEETVIECRSLAISISFHEFTRQGDTVLISARTEPAGLVESYSSSDESVVVVGESGLVTAVGPGNAVITATCGNKTVECMISCKWEEEVATTEPIDLPEGDLELENPDMSFFAKGESYVQTVKGIAPGTPVIWSSEDESVATVDAGGHITAVGPGVTKVFATVGNSSGYCWVRCNFTEDDDDDNR